jgi:hypothetical protein
MKTRLSLFSTLSLVCLLAAAGCIPPNEGHNSTTTTDNSTSASIDITTPEQYASAPADDDATPANVYAANRR